MGLILEFQVCKILIRMVSFLVIVILRIQSLIVALVIIPLKNCVTQFLFFRIPFFLHIYTLYSSSTRVKIHGAKFK